MQFIEILESRRLFTVLNGDTNFNNVIDGDDYAAIDAGYSAQASTYFEGDFDYNRRIDADDYFVIDANYGKTIFDKVGVRHPELITTTRIKVNQTDPPNDLNVYGAMTIENIHFIDCNINFYTNATVIVKNCTFIKHPVPFYTAPGYHPHVIVQDCDISWATPEANGEPLREGSPCAAGYGISFYRNYIHASRNSDFAFQMQDAVYEGNYFTDIGTSPDGAAREQGPHIDFFQWSGFDPVSFNIDIHDNYFDLAYGNTPLAHVNAILFSVDATDIRFERNWIKGGDGYQMYLAAPATNVHVNDNTFMHWGYAPVLYRPGGLNGTTWRDVLEFSHNSVLRDGTIQPFEVPPGANSDLFVRGEN